MSEDNTNSTMQQGARTSPDTDEQMKIFMEAMMKSMADLQRMVRETVLARNETVTQIIQESPSTPSTNSEDESRTSQPYTIDIAVPTSTHVHRVLLRDVEETLPQYSGEDSGYPVQVWLSEMDELAAAYSWTELDILIAAKKTLTGAAKNWLDRHRSVTSWPLFKELISKDFADNTSSRIIHDTLAKRKKKQGETMLSYLQCMLTIGKRGGLTDAVVIEYIVDGIPNDGQDKTYLYGAKTIAQLREALIAYEKAAKMIERISREYWIDKLQAKVENYVRNCITCILGNRKQGKIEGLLNPIPKEDVPLHTIHIDHLGPLQCTSNTYKHMLVLFDAFTKFVWIFTVKSTGTAEVLNKLRTLSDIFGNPRRFITDRGTAFTSNEFQEYCQQENIVHLTIATGVPRGNGQVEQINSIILAAVTKLAIEDPMKWYKHVGRVQKAINGTYQRSIGCKPFELLFGAKMRIPEDAHMQEIIDEEMKERFEKARDEARAAAKKQIKKVQEENKKDYNKRSVRARKYKENDIVAIKCTQFGPGLKLALKFLGPYEVTKVKPRDRYDVKKIDGDGPIETTCSADHMKPWRGFSKDEFDDEDSENEQIE